MYPLLYRRPARRAFCAGVIVFALLLRLALIPGALRRLPALAGQALGNEAVYRAVLFFQTGAAGSLPPEASAPAEHPEKEDPAKAGTDGAAPTAPEEDPAGAADPPGRETDPAGEGIAPFTAAEAERITLRGNCSYPADKTALLLEPLDWTLTPGPKVLILHSHSCESYTPSPGLDYEASGDYRTLEADRSVIAVGDALAAELEKLGVSCVHDRSLHDYPDYNRSYASARATTRELLAKDPSIVLVIDLHRDALDRPVRETAELEGQTVAPLMLVVGTDEGGLDHPGWARNLSCALKLQALANREFPGLMKAISFRRERFNGDLSPGAFIVEAGSTGNTLPEAKAAMPALARLVADLLRLAEEEGAAQTP